MTFEAANTTTQKATTPAADVSVLSVQNNFSQKKNERNTSYKNGINIQPKLTVGAPDDPYEREADSVADKVMRMPEQDFIQHKPGEEDDKKVQLKRNAGTNFIQRKCEECDKEEKIHRKPLSQAITPFIQTKSDGEGSVSVPMSSSIENSRGNGSALDGSTQSFMENRMGADFSNVKIHTDSESVQMNTELKAQAFTVGNDVYFNQGKFEPHNEEGKRLLAHELTHVVQQTSSTVSVQNKLIQRKTTLNGSYKHNVEPGSKMPVSVGSDQYVSRKPSMLHHSGVIQQIGRGPPPNSAQFSHSTATSNGDHVLAADTGNFKEGLPITGFSNIPNYGSVAIQQFHNSADARISLLGNSSYSSQGENETINLKGGALAANSGTSKNKRRHSPRKLPIKVSGESSGKKGADETKGGSIDTNPQSKRRPAVKNKGKQGYSNDKTHANTAGANQPVQPQVTPQKNPDFQKAKGLITHESKKQQKHHQPANTKREEAVKASALPTEDQISQSSKEKNTGDMENVSQKLTAPEKKFSADSFKERFWTLINAAKPKTESEAKKMAKTPPVGDISESFSGDLAEKQSVITDPLEKTISNPEAGVAEKPIIPLPKPVRPPVPASVDSKLVIPKIKTDQAISEQKEIDRIDTAMSKNKLSDDQLTESREPLFTKAYTKKEFAKQKAAEAPAEYRKKEAGILGAAEAKASKTTAHGLNGLADKNTKSGDDVFASQSGTESVTEERQRGIKTVIDGFYDWTVSSVKSILQTMTDKVKVDFKDSLKRNTDSFNENLKSRISDYYGYFTIDDKLFGPDDVVVEKDGSTRALTQEEGIAKMFGNGPIVPTINPDVYKIFVTERETFTQAMDIELDAIAKNVEQGLIDAHNAITTGNQLIAAFKSTLKGDELVYATQLGDEVTAKFGILETSIDDAKEDLLNSLADEYKDNMKAMEKSFKDISDDLKKGWIDKAVEFVEAVAKTISDLVDLVVSSLKRLANIIWDIVKHPIRFFETLVTGLLDGVGEFIDHIGTYLQESFWTWITGAVQGAGIKLTPGSGVEGMFKMVLNVLNLGPEDLKQVAGKVLGQEFIQMIDKVMDLINKGMEIGAKILEPVVILFTQGPAALWEYIKQHVEEFIQSAFDRIRDSVFFALIEKGIKWVASFFIPGGGFVKVVGAILSAFQFVAANIDKIRSFLDAIFSSMERAIAGDSSGVKNKVITGLKTGIVMAFDFLATELGLEDLVSSVHDIIHSLRSAILSAVEFILIKVKPYVLALVEKIKSLYQRGKEAVLGAGRKLLGWWAMRKRLTFKNGESHTLYFEGIAPDVVLMMESTPISYKSFIKSIVITTKDAAKKEEQQTAKSSALKTAKELDELIEEGKRLSRDKSSDGTITKDISPEFQQKLDELADLTIIFSDRDDGQLPVSSEPQYGALENGFASSMHIKMLTKLGPGGTKVTVESPIMENLYLRKERTRVYYIAGHLLNNNLHGPGFTWQNLTPLTQKTNQDHLRWIEAEIKSAVSQGRAFDYEVTVIYERSLNKDLVKQLDASTDKSAETKKKVVIAEQYVPTEIIANVHEVDYNGKEITTGDYIAGDMSIPNEIDQSGPDNYIL